MSVRKRTWTTRNGETKTAWIIDYVDQDGDRHIETFSRKKPADDRHLEVRDDLRKGTLTVPSKTITVEDAANDWIARVEANGMKDDGPVERSTIRQYREHLRLHILPRLGRLKLGQLNTKVIEGFRDDLLKELSRPLARKVLTSLKSVLKVAKFAHVADGVSIGISKRTKKKLEVGLDIPTPAEIKRLIDATTETRSRALLLTAALTGLRASELRGLRWSDIDLKASELNVRQRADRFNVIGQLKSHSGQRTVPLSPDALKALKEWKLACPKAKADLVFPTRTGAVIHHKNMLNSLAPWMIAAGVVKRDDNGALKPKYALHAFRHFFASWCLNPKDRGGRELTPKLVQSWMGHSSITITFDLYSHLFEARGDHAELAAAASALLA